MIRAERALVRLRSFDQLRVDAVLAVIFCAIGLATVFAEGIRDDSGVLLDDFREPTALAAE